MHIKHGGARPRAAQTSSRVRTKGAVCPRSSPRRPRQTHAPWPGTAGIEGAHAPLRPADAACGAARSCTIRTTWPDIVTLTRSGRTRAWSAVSRSTAERGDRGDLPKPRDDPRAPDITSVQKVVDTRQPHQSLGTEQTVPVRDHVDVHQVGWALGCRVSSRTFTASAEGGLTLGRARAPRSAWRQAPGPSRVVGAGRRAVIRAACVWCRGGGPPGHVAWRVRSGALRAGDDGAGEVLAVAARIVSVLRRTPDGARLDWEMAVPVGLAAALDPADLAEAVGALAENAARHAASSVRIAACAEGCTLRLTVSDDGPGIP